MTHWSAELRRCVRCGACRQVCPVFDLTHLETDVARGLLARLERAAAGERFTAADREALSRCLQCGRCRAVCPAELDLPSIIRRAKAESGAAGAAEAMMVDLLADAQRLRRLTSRARSFAEWLARRTPDGSGLRLRFVVPYLEAGRYLPRVPATPYLDRVAPRPAAGGERVALFLGCGAGRLFDGVGEAVDRILATQQLVAAVPEQPCCGLPAWGLGAERAAKTAAAQWLDAFPPAQYDAVLVVCASCAAHLQTGLPAVLAGTPRAPEAEAAAARAHDLFAWLRARGWRTDLRGRRLAVHLPCHARHGVREGDSVLALLRECSAEVIALDPELDGACCGMGGSFGVRHAGLSRGIGEPKARAMLAAHPDTIVTTCTGCLLQLRDLIDRIGGRIPVVHAAQVFG